MFDHEPIHICSEVETMQMSDRPIDLTTCTLCGESGPLSSTVARIVVEEASDSHSNDVPYTYYVHPSCDENATPEQLNAIRDAILGE